MLTFEIVNKLMDFCHDKQSHIFISSKFATLRLEFVFYWPRFKNGPVHYVIPIDMIRWKEKLPLEANDWLERELYRMIQAIEAHE